MRKMFSKNQIKDIVQEGIDNGEIDVGGGGSKSCIAYEGTLSLPTNVSMSDWSLHRAIQDGNILWITLVGRISNNGDSSASVGNLFTFTLPSEVSSHIYRQNGKPCNETELSAQKVLTTGITVDTSSKFIELRCENANEFSLLFTSNLSINANDYKDVDLRLPIFLDIGETE